MSLVLEALKKLDREKGREERGFEVMAAAPWPTRAARRWPAWAVVAAAGAIAALLAVRAQRAPAPAVPIPSSAAAAAPVAPPPVPPATSERFAGERLAPARPVRRAVATPAPLDPAAPVAAGQGEAATTSAPPEPALRLQAVSERDGQPIAIVSDRLVRVGDEVEGMRVLAIRPTEVDVEIKGRRMTLKF